jgi:hypothetical protein
MTLDFYMTLDFFIWPSTFYLHPRLFTLTLDIEPSNLDKNQNSIPMADAITVIKKSRVVFLWQLTTNDKLLFL